MKTRILILLFIMACTLPAAIFQTASKGKGVLINRGESAQWCPNCGMHLIKFFKTNHVVHLENGKAMQFCSLFCLVESERTGRFERKNLLKTQAVDLVTETFHPVSKLHYIVGSQKPGTMTSRSQYAFLLKDDAVAFAKRNGGNLLTYNQTYKAARDQYDQDRKRISEKRERMMYPMGKRIYQKICQQKKLAAIRFSNMGELKLKIRQENLCGKLTNRQLQAVALYLFFKKNEHSKEGSGTVANKSIPKNAKCPVCGMFVAKYPKWAAIVRIGNRPYYFDGSKDMFKFLQNLSRYTGLPSADRKKSNFQLQVTDYYTDQFIDGKRAYYVIGSDILGPMGHELIPHRDQESARQFLKDHQGKKIVRITDIDKTLIHRLDH